MIKKISLLILTITLGLSSKLFAPPPMLHSVLMVSDDFLGTVVSSLNRGSSKFMALAGQGSLKIWANQEISLDAQTKTITDAIKLSQKQNRNPLNFQKPPTSESELEIAATISRPLLPNQSGHTLAIDYEMELTPIHCPQSFAFITLKYVKPHLKQLWQMHPNAHLSKQHTFVRGLTVQRTHDEKPTKSEMAKMAAFHRDEMQKFTNACIDMGHHLLSMTATNTDGYLYLPTLVLNYEVPILLQLANLLIPLDQDNQVITDSELAAHQILGLIYENIREFEKLTTIHDLTESSILAQPTSQDKLRHLIEREIEAKRPTTAASTSEQKHRSLGLFSRGK